jgi:phage recombination protein Bet
MSAVAKLNTKQSLVSKFGSRFNVDESEVKNLLKNTAFKVKDGSVTDEQMSALMIIANEYNLNPFTKEIYAYPDKGGIVPVVGVDGWNRIMNEHDQFDGLEFKYSEDTVKHKGKDCHVWIEAIITRKDRSKPIIAREYFDEVVRTPNFATPWDSHPKRMHRHKALIQCVRIAFGFAGIYDEDEAQRIIEKDVTPTNEPEQTTVVYLDDETFNTLKSKYRETVVSGKKSADDFVNFVESRGALMTDAQKVEVNSWVKPKPTVVEGEAQEVDDDFTSEYNKAEGGE